MKRADRIAAPCARRGRLGVFFCCAIAVLAWLLSARPALAVGESCSATVIGVVYGSYNLFTGAVDGAGNVRVTCTGPLVGSSVLVGYSVKLSQGNGNSYAPRKMFSGANQLAYNLFTNSARTTIWGDGSAGTSSIPDGYLLAALATVVRDYPIYGRVPAGQNAAVGAYIDQIIVTIDY